VKTQRKQSTDCQVDAPGTVSAIEARRSVCFD
jgi:hypothetical protein